MSEINQSMSCHLICCNCKRILKEKKEKPIKEKKIQLTADEKKEKIRLKRKKDYDNGYVYYNKIKYLLKTLQFPEELELYPCSGVEQYKTKYEKLMEYSKEHNYCIKLYKNSLKQ